MPARTSMSTSSSEASSTLSAHARKLGFPKSDIQINLKNHFKTKTYTSSSVVSGDVTITTQRDVRFDSVEIIMVGSAKTKTDGYSAPHESTYTFLKLVMPISESVYPVPRVLESSRTLSVPFHFVLPNFLTIGACTHKVESEHVKRQHLCLPPSMGSWARGNWEKDDLSPQMADIEYTIRARVWKQPELQARPTKIMETIKSIQVLPTFPEDAPLSISKSDRLYCMTKTKAIRKNLLSAKLGKFTASAEQPRAIMLRPDGQVSTGTAAQIDLRFEPVSADTPPPKITGISSKITAHTYFSAGPIGCPPNMGDFNKAGVSDRRGVYSTSVNLPATTPLEKPTWLTYQARRDSGYFTDTAPENTASEDDADEEERQRQQQRPRRKSITIANLVRPSKQQQASSPPRRPRSSPVYHTTAMHVPVARLPTGKKFFVPTFHSCIASRVYTLHVSLQVAASAGGSTTVSLDLPLQVGVEPERAMGPGGAIEGEALPSFEDAVEEAAVDEFFRPRVLSVPEIAFQETSVLPGYGAR
ncbi:rrestin domain-containing protein [Diaporthe amygdali]|uniref:rrestin domain-containing protein n=1 Tax=Phomopsis amygdali TaxID=1214568 RepID=UPI0022FF189F|nr:rrestin domain-containing protein [Diaporthe amygdali]KAJ0117928.1 rrestin domain-containing protein [Diaporthe amygdali]